MTHEQVSIEFTETEIQAMEAKIQNPKEIVICPRCGGRLLFREWPTAVEVRCETENCLHGSIRGI
jgi:DNA-directed RNA polymerase subunit RPC12/RpoP